VLGPALLLDGSASYVLQPSDLVGDPKDILVWTEFYETSGNAAIVGFKSESSSYDLFAPYIDTSGNVHASPGASSNDIRFTGDFRNKVIRFAMLFRDNDNSLKIAMTADDQLYTYEAIIAESEIPNGTASDISFGVDFDSSYNGSPGNYATGAIKYAGIAKDIEGVGMEELISLVEYPYQHLSIA
jgi:hypothetical protein